MLTFRRLAIYALLMIPIAYVMGITDAARRVIYYVIIAGLLAPIACTYLLHLVFRRKWPRYQRFLVRRAGRFRRWLPRLAQLALLAWLLVPAIIMTPIGLGLRPLPFAIIGGALWLILLLQAWRKSLYPPALRLDAIALLLALIYAAILAMTYSFMGTTPAACAELAKSPYLTPIISRADLADSPSVESCFPYDVKTDAAADRLFFTLKQKRSGFIKSLGEQNRANDAIGMTTLSAPSFHDASLILVRGPHAGQYPQRITVNSRRREIYVVVLDIDGGHTVRVISYDGEFKEGLPIKVPFEPIRVYDDESREWLIILGYEGWAGVYGLESKHKVFINRYDNLGFIGLLDTMVPNPRLKAYYASVVSRYFLLLNADNLRVRLRSKVGAPTIGLDYDPLTNRVFAAGTLTREILVLDGETLDVRDRIPTGTTLRELYFDRRRRLIVTAGYTNGLLDFYDIDNDCRRVGRLFIGALARGIHIEPESERLFVTSSCGLFEVKTDRLLKDSALHRRPF